MSQQQQQVLLPLNYPPFAAKLKVILKMLLKRISLRLKQEEQQAKLSQREVARLLNERNKEQKAYYKVEAMIMDDSTVQMLEILENYSEMLLVRIPILNNTITSPKELKENESLEKGIKTLLLANLHFPEFKELSQFKELMMLKFGRGFVEKTLQSAKKTHNQETEEQKEGEPLEELKEEIEKVDDSDNNLERGFDEKFFRLSERNIAEESIVETYLKEIAMAYKVPYSKLPIEEEIEELTEIKDNTKISGEEESKGQSDDFKEPKNKPQPKTTSTEMSDLEKRFALLKNKK
ncbi:hypothetical protein ACO0SA_002536 [Hanseniaspora valbyensis]